MKCDVCREEYKGWEDDPNVCGDCAREMLQCAASFEVDGFVSVDVTATGKAYVAVGEDVGPGIEYLNHGPFSLGEAFRLAKVYADTGDESVLRPSDPQGGK